MSTELILFFGIMLGVGFLVSVHGIFVHPAIGNKPTSTPKEESPDPQVEVDHRIFTARYLRQIAESDGSKVVARYALNLSVKPSRGQALRYRKFERQEKRRAAIEVTSGRLVEKG